MKLSQKIYDSPSISKNVYNEKSKEYHKKNLLEIKKRKNKLYKLNEDYIEIKKRNQSPSQSNNANCIYKLILILKK
jgi:hypothetical protein